MLKKILYTLLLAVPMAHAQTKINLATQARGLDYVPVFQAQYPDIGAALAAADAAYAGQAVTFGVAEPGKSIDTSFTVGAGHNLYFPVGVNFGTYLVPTTNNTVTCGVGATITTTQSPSKALADGSNAFFAAPSGAAEVAHFKVAGCNWNGYGMAGGYILDSAGPTQDVTIADNYTWYAGLYKQNAASASNPSLRLTVKGNTCDWSGSPQNPSAACVLSYGALQNSLVSTNHFTKPYYGVELFASDAKGNNPSYNLADILTSGLTDDLIEDNECESVVACAWTSVSYRVSMVGNLAHICSDVCFDFESGAFNSGVGNTAEFATNGGFAEEYGGFHNTWDANVSHGGTGYLITSPTTGTTIQNAKHDNAGSGQVGIFFYEEGSAINAKLLHNSVVDGLIAYGAGTYTSSQISKGNTYFYDAAIPGSNVGYPQGAGCGFNLGNFDDATFDVSDGDTIQTTVPQTQPGLCAATSVSNYTESYLIKGTTLVGPWATDMALGDSGQNTVHPVTMNLRGITFASGSVTTSSQYGVAVNVTCSGSGGSYMLNGTATPCS